MPDVNTNPNDFTARQSEIHQLNAELMFDDVMAEMAQVRKVKSSQDNAWETLRYRIASNRESIDHFVNAAAATSDQTGQTSNQQTTSPIRTGAADNLAAGAAPANRTIDAATATIATAAAGIATADESIATTLAKISDALNAVETAVAGLAAQYAAAPKSA